MIVGSRVGLVSSDNGSTDVTYKGRGVYDVSGMYNQNTIDTALDNLQFEPVNNSSDAGRVLTDITVKVNDQKSGFVNVSGPTRVTVSRVNDAPTLTDGTPFLDAIDENAGDDDGDGTDGDDDVKKNNNNPGTTVATLLTRTGGTNDVDSSPLGLAVVGVDNTNGTYQFSTDGGTTFSNFSGGESLSSATLLDETALVRFVPDVNFNGDNTRGIVFKAWDQFAASNGQTGVDTTPNGGTGAENGFSSTTDAAGITVNAVNDAPTLVVNRARPVIQGGTGGLSQARLQATDPETTDPAALTYTIDTDATEGQLVNTATSTQLDQGDTFTQQAVNDSNVEYQSSSTTIARSDTIGFTVADGSGGSTAGTIDFVLSPAPYGSGSALALDGSGDWVQSDAVSDALDGAAALTASAWVYPDPDISTGQTAVLAFNGDTQDNRNILFYESERFQYYDPVIEFQPSTETFAAGQWYHVAFVVEPDGSGVLYVDGTQQATFTSDERPVAEGAFSIGQEFDGASPSDFFQGRIDQVRLWKSALTQAEIQGRAARTINVSSATATDLVAAYRFDESGGPAYDVAGGQDGTFQNDAGVTNFSGAPVGQQSAAVQSGSQSLGPSGAAVTVENVSASGTDALVVSRHGTTGGPAFTASEDGEDFSQISGDVTERLSVVWGFTAIGSPTADVTLDYSGLSGFSTPDNVRLLKRSGGRGTAWQDVSGNWAWDEQAKTFSKTGVSSFSQFAIGEAATALPVELAGFAATAAEDAVTLTWQTASETGNAGFRVQRRGDGKTGGPGDWLEVGAVDGAGTTTEVQSYAFTDTVVPYDADSLTYRLKQIDTDGTVSYSETRTVARNVVQQVQLLGTYPNPARGRTTVRFAIPEGNAASDVTLRLYDVLGRQVRKVRAGAEAGRHELQLDTGGLASGTYFLRLTAGGTTRTQQVMVVQ